VSERCTGSCAVALHSATGALVGRGAAVCQLGGALVACSASCVRLPRAGPARHARAAVLRGAHAGALPAAGLPRQQRHADHQTAVLVLRPSAAHRAGRAGERAFPHFMRPF
jgi:hypothetical protein